MKIVFVTVSPPAVKFLSKAATRINQFQQKVIELKLYYVVSEYGSQKAAQMVTDIALSQIVFLDLMGAPPSIVELVGEGCEKCQGYIIPFGASSREYLRLGAFTADAMKSESKHAPSMEAMKKMQDMAEKMGKVMPGKMRDMRNYSLLMKYYQSGSEDNLYNMLLLLLTEYGPKKGLPKPQPPKPYLPVALYDAKTMTPYKKAAEFEKAMGFDPSKPKVGLLFTAYSYPTDTSGAVAAIVSSLSPFCSIYPIGTSEHFSAIEGELRSYLLNIQGGIDLLLDCTPFRLAAGPMGGDVQKGIDLLQDTNVPYLHPFFLTRRTEREWREHISGCSANEVLISVMLPELDGAIETIPVAAISDPILNAEYDVEEYELVPIAERLDHLVARVKRHLALRKKENKDKKIAIICYNYPPGESNLFGGAFLDTFQSVAAILARLKSAGYTIDVLSAEQLREIFTAGKAVNSGQFDSDWDGWITYDLKKYQSAPEIQSCWGKPPGEIMAENGAFRIPGVVAGNVFIGLQPTRGVHELDEKSVHDKSKPPHHQYVAFYQWIEKEFCADAVVHVGTHGTLEFLKGKESGMSGDCWPDRLIGELPHIYLYYCGNPSEAIVAKRRSHANLVSYQPPVFVKSNLYGEWLELLTAVEDYRHLEAVSPASAESALALAKKKAEELNLNGDLDEIEGELYRMQDSLIPKGLHILGQSYSEEEIIEYEKGLLAMQGDGELSTEKMDEVKAAARRAVPCRELEGLISALESRYNPPRLAGDIYRNPEVLPTGYNLYQFDPRLIPSANAMQRGWEICENTLNKYYTDNGNWPNSTAVIAWGLETSRTQGETVGQILAYLGVRISKQSHIWDKRFEVIPMDELCRPRIDITINICGFFRDMFRNIIDLLDDLLQSIYELDETDEENYYRANSKNRYFKLLDEGYNEQEARQLATARIFGPEEGEYGTGLTTFFETKNWQEEQELGAAFTASLRYVYNRRLNGKKVQGLYEDNLKCVDVVSQLRCNHEYEITDLDHYYEFFGGLSKSVELVKGRKAAMYITDTTGNCMITETVDRSIARGLRTRVLNPKWIDGMLAHPYHGVQKIADRFENVMGLAATTGAVEESLYDDLESCFVKDGEMRRRMAENNPHAYKDILEQMMEYSERGYWKAEEEQLARIRQAYLELENHLEETV